MFTGVCLSTGGGVPGPGLGVPGRGWVGCDWSWGRDQGVPGQGGCLLRGGVPGGDPPTATAAGGTHPTGMHSCIYDLFQTILKGYKLQSRNYQQEKVTI